MPDKNHLIILNDAEEAAYFHNTLENLIQPIDLFYFPSSFKNKKNYRLLNSSHVMLRTEALTRLSTGGNKKIMVTFPEALMEKVVLPNTLSANIISIKTNDTLDIDAMLEKFVGYGFERTDFVYEPGQFAMRGGILDIYSFGNEKPYRVELFGNEVDSIRIFDPETQLSERKLMQVNIIPNVETQFDDEKKISLLEFLPENTMVWMQDWEFIREKWLEQEDDLDLFLDRQDIAKPETDEDDHLTNDWCKNLILPQRNNCRDNLNQGTGFPSGTSRPFRTQALETDFQTRAQPAFNRQFDLLIKDLKSWEAKKFSTFIFADNPKQLERLHSIFDDLKAEIHFESHYPFHSRRIY